MGGDNCGETGEGFSGTYIKDTWTKPKQGRIEGGRWGRLGWGEWWWEKGDNCTWTTIKERKKWEKIINHCHHLIWWFIQKNKLNIIDTKKRITNINF